MPKKCCVIGCKSGYDTNKEKVNMFQFPKDEDLKMKWLISIGRKDYRPSKWASVCSKHFQEDDVIRHCVGVDPGTGAEALFPTKVKLKDGVLPLLNLNNLIEPKLKVNDGQHKVKATQKPRRPGRPQKISKPLSEHSSSDDDIPLETLKNQCLSAKANRNDSPDQSVDNFSDTDLKTNIVSLDQQFSSLLDKYEQLKNRHVALGQAIDVLGKVNIELKCKIFKF